MRSTSRSRPIRPTPLSLPAWNERSAACAGTSAQKPIASRPLPRSFAAAYEPPHLRLLEHPNEFAVQVTVFDVVIENADRPLEGQGLLVWPIARRQSVVNIGDAHDLRLDRNLARREVIRIPLSVEA